MHNSFFLIKDNFEPLQSPQLGQSNNFVNNFMAKGQELIDDNKKQMLEQSFERDGNTDTASFHQSIQKDIVNDTAEFKDPEVIPHRTINLQDLIHQQSSQVLPASVEKNESFQTLNFNNCHKD